jgi:hypothetical protein
MPLPLQTQQNASPFWIILLLILAQSEPQIIGQAAGDAFEFESLPLRQPH